MVREDFLATVSSSEVGFERGAGCAHKNERHHLEAWAVGTRFSPSRSTRPNEENGYAGPRGQAHPESMTFLLVSRTCVILWTPRTLSWSDRLM